MPVTKKQYTDIDINFNKNQFTDDVSVKLNDNAIRQSVMNIILTRQGERPFHPRFGVGLHKFLFENLDPLDKATFYRDVVAQLAVYEPRVKLSNITWDESKKDSNELSITVDFFIRKGTQSRPQQQSLKIEISKVR
tara:strand:- start:593 stop:1000 length:408 start_codon:yes stop_codon:yes gene_type:complete